MMEDSKPEQPNDPDSETDQDQIQAQKPLWRRVMYFLLTRGATVYLGVCLIVFLIQRQMLYHPSRVQRITAKDASLPPEVVEDVEFTTSDGLTLRGWYFKAKEVSPTDDAAAEASNQDRRVILFFHGNAGDRRHRMNDVRILRASGVDVFMTDYRGFGDNPGDPSATGLAMDARAAWKYLTEKRGIDPQQIVVFGESLGSGVGVRLAAECCTNGQPPGGLILRSAFSSIADAAAERFPWLPVRVLLRDRYPSTSLIPSVTCPILMIHGTDDQIVPYRLGQKLFAAAPDQSPSGIKKRLLTLEGVGHNGILFAAGREHADAVDQFLKDLP